MSTSSCKHRPSTAVRTLCLGLCAALGVIFLPACSDDDPGSNQNSGAHDGATDAHTHTHTTFTLWWLEREDPKLDLLFVVDNTASLKEERAGLAEAIENLLDMLDALPGGRPDYHVGFITPDLGTPGFAVSGCDPDGGDDARLGYVSGQNLAETCLQSGHRYLIDVEPPACNIEKDENGDCTTWQCHQLDCETLDTPPGSDLMDFHLDRHSCPRCRNYLGSAADALACQLGLPAYGCVFRQHLEATVRALRKQDTPYNKEFRRQGAYLGVLFITDNDDCSAADPGLFDPADTAPDSPLGPLTPFRCFEFGVTCDVNGRQQGRRRDCTPREDTQALLHPITRYTALMEALADPARTAVAAVAGPSGDEISVTVGLNGTPSLDPACATFLGSATPAVRLTEFVQRMGYLEPERTQRFGLTSICSLNWTGALEGFGQWLTHIMTQERAVHCLPENIAGCPHHGYEDCGGCYPQCTFQALTAPGSAAQKTWHIPPCTTICREGPCQSTDIEPCDEEDSGHCHCPSDLDPTRLGGKQVCAPLLIEVLPNSKDSIRPDLADVLPAREPTCTGPQCPPETAGRASACWAATENEECNLTDDPTGKAFQIIWSALPPGRVVIEATCHRGETETACDDGIDNDADCKTDEDDLDCQS